MYKILCIYIYTICIHDIICNIVLYICIYRQLTNVVNLVRETAKIPHVLSFSMQARPWVYHTSQVESSMFEGWSIDKKLCCSTTHKQN